MALTIEQLFPDMRDVGSSATYFLPRSSWRARAGISGKIFQERSVFKHVSSCGKYTQWRRNTTRVMTRITVKDQDVVDWIDGGEVKVVKPAGKHVKVVGLESGRIIANDSWRTRSVISGKIFQERCVEQRYGRVYAPTRFEVNRLTLDDANVVDWLTQENTFNPAAIKTMKKNEMDLSTYAHEETRFGVGRGNVKDRRPMTFGIDAPCEAIGWKGREYYTDEEFFAWKKPTGLKVKDMARLDYNVYNRICKYRKMERPVPM